MLFSSVVMALPGHTPASVVVSRPYWYALILLLAVLSVMNLMTLEIIGSLLSCLMLFLAWMIARKNMSEAPKYIVIYAVLSVLNFFFDVVPLIMSLHGRSAVTVEPGVSTHYEGIEQTMYTRTIRTTPFFDRKQGLLYNIESASMILSPACMLMGTYLAVRARREIQQAVPVEEDAPRDMEHTLQERAPQGVASRGASTSFERFQGMGHKLMS
mmetsp:Transcript_112797/g.313885  ORF Transcript_112797/g.313885 Transcript_112797/m.313885 type:complete len:213 (+) Transcript_112797:76-714(+)